MATPRKDPKDIKPGGRPRLHDRDQMADKLREWCAKDDSTNLNGFCAQEMISPDMIIDWAAENPKFAEAMKTAKACIADRREKYLAQGKLHIKAYDLNATTYDKFMKIERREAIEHEAQQKAKAESESINPALLSEIAKIKANTK